MARASWAAALGALAVACSPWTVAGAGKVFGDVVDFFYVGLMMIGIIIFTLTFEYLTDKLNEALEEHKVYLHMVQKVYEELMILGFIAFILTIFIEMGIHIPHAWFHAFEWAHILIFAVAILFVLNACIASWAMERQRDKWHLARMTPTQEILERLEILKPTVENSRWHKIITTLPLVETEWRLLADFKLIRLMFLHGYELPRTFDYMSYIKRKLHHNIEHSVHIGVKTWFFVALLAGLLNGAVLLFRATVDDREQQHLEFVAYCETHGNETDCVELAADDGHRRLLSAAHEGSSRRMLVGASAPDNSVCIHRAHWQECETELTAQFAAFTALAVGWGLFLIQLSTALILEGKWFRCFDIKKIPRGIDITGLIACLSEWKKLVLEQKILSTQDYKERKKGRMSNEMSELEHIYTEEDEKTHLLVSQFMQLSNCFYVAVWSLHVRPTCHLFLSWPWVWDIALLLPAMLLVFWLVPMQVKYQALLSAMIRQDVELVAEVFAFMDEVVAVRQRIRYVLLQHVAESSDENMEEKSEREQAAMAADYIFQLFDADGSGSLTYIEVKKGLAALQIHLTRSELMHMMRVIDPDLSGDLTKQEWENFMLSSDEALEMRQVTQNSEGNAVIAENARKIVGAAVDIGSAAVNPIGAMSKLTNMSTHNASMRHIEPALE